MPFSTDLRRCCTVNTSRPEAPLPMLLVARLSLQSARQGKSSKGVTWPQHARLRLDLRVHVHVPRASALGRVWHVHAAMRAAHTMCMRVLKVPASHTAPRHVCVCVGSAHTHMHTHMHMHMHMPHAHAHATSAPRTPPRSRNVTRGYFLLLTSYFLLHTHRLEIVM